LNICLRRAGAQSLLGDLFQGLPILHSVSMLRLHISVDDFAVVAAGRRSLVDTRGCYAVADRTDCPLHPFRWHAGFPRAQLELLADLSHYSCSFLRRTPFPAREFIVAPDQALHGAAFSWISNVVGQITGALSLDSGIGVCCDLCPV